MKQSAKVTQEELQKELGVPLRTVKRMTAESQDKGYIVRSGNNRPSEQIVKGQIVFQCINKIMQVQTSTPSQHHIRLRQSRCRIVALEKNRG